MPGRPFVAVAAAVVLAGCGSSTPSAAPSGSAAPTTRAPSTGAPHPTFVMPTPSINPCTLTAAQVRAVVGFPVTYKPGYDKYHCLYDGPDGDGQVSFQADAFTTLNLKQDQGDDTFSLGGRYVTITDETGFAHEAFTAVKNPGDQSPGVIADITVWLAPGHLKIRIYYPSAGRPPGRAHALRLAHLILG